MRITGFCPIIISKDAEDLINLFKDLGFEKVHIDVSIMGQFDMGGSGSKKDSDCDDSSSFGPGGMFGFDMSSFDPGNFAAGFSPFNQNNSFSSTNKLIQYLVYLGIMIVSVIILKLIKR